MVIAYLRRSVKELSIEVRELSGPSSDVTISATSRGEIAVPVTSSFKKIVAVAVAQIDSRSLSDALRLLGFYYDAGAGAVKVILYNTSASDVTVSAGSLKLTVIVFGY